MRTLLLVVLLVAAGSRASAGAEESIDPATGLIKAPGWELAAANCGACHSHALVIAQRGDAAFWRSTIRWMQKTQNLWAIPEPSESQLIEYLAENYNESDWGRRPPLPLSLMPEQSSD